MANDYGWCMLLKYFCWFYNVVYIYIYIQNLFHCCRGINNKIWCSQFSCRYVHVEFIKEENDFVIVVLRLMFTPQFLVLLIFCNLWPHVLLDFSLSVLADFICFYNPQERNIITARQTACYNKYWNEKMLKPHVKQMHKA